MKLLKISQGSQATYSMDPSRWSSLSLVKEHREATPLLPLVEWEPRAVRKEIFVYLWLLYLLKFLLLNLALKPDEDMTQNQGEVEGISKVC